MSDSCTCACASTPRRRRPTATLVIASLALFMSLGGTSYAAVKAKSIGTKQLKNNAVTSGKIARNGVTASDIRAGVVDGTKIRVNSIGSQHILDGSIGAQDIQPGSIGAREIAGNSINSAQIADQSLGLGELNQATVDLFKDVPTTLVLDGGQDSTTQGMPSTSSEPSDVEGAFTAVRSYSVPASGTGRTGTTLVQSQVTVSTSTGATVSCWISVNDVPRAVGTTTLAAPATGVIPVTTVVGLKEFDVVETRCRALGTATANTRTSDVNGKPVPPATSMTLMRVDD